WAGLRLALARRDYILAAELAETLPDSYLEDHPLAKYDALLTRAIETPQSVQHLLPINEANGQLPEVIADSIATGILYALSSVDFNDPLSQTDHERLEVVKLVRPNDLYATYRLWVGS
ncbi:MAG: hypothetical protein MUC64_07655, partial [Rubritepida sp.]|nr:hypothetical protein [Rubritepida sp.]